MTDEIKNETPSNETMDANAYVEQLTQLKQNSVDKTEYNKLVEDNRKLAEALANNRVPETQTEDKPKPDIEAIRKELFNNNKELTNLEYATKTIQLRQALMDAGQPDPFLPFGHHVVPGDNDAADAQRVADFLCHAIEVADGNPAIFCNELERGLVDVVPAAKKGGRHTII